MVRIKKKSQDLKTGGKSWKQTVRHQNKHWDIKVGAKTKIQPQEFKAGSAGNNRLQHQNLQINHIWRGNAKKVVGKR